MNKYVISAMLFFVCGLLLVPASQAHASHESENTSVIISEINWAGSSASTADEWIELYNPTSERVDLSGWILTGSATSGDALALEEGAFIEAGDVLLIANYNTSHANTTLTVEPDLVTSSLSLPNSGLDIMLANADGSVVDSVSMTGKPDAGNSTDPFASMERDLATLAWSTSTASENLSDDSQLGTPGLMSAGTAEQAEESDADAVEEEVAEASETGDVVCICTSVEEESGIQDEDASSEDLIEDEAVEDVDEVTEDVVEEDEETVDEIEDEPVEEEIVEETAPEEPGTTSFEVGSLTLSEIVSDPEDGDEWIEIYHPGDEAIDTTDWTVRDATGKSTGLGEDSLEPGAYLVIENPKGQLNNGGDTVELVDPSGNVIDSVEYGTDSTDAPEKGESLALVDGDWVITTDVSKGTINIASQTDEEVYEEVTDETEVASDEAEASSSGEDQSSGDDSAADVADRADEHEAVSDDEHSCETTESVVVAVAESSGSSSSSTSSTATSTSTSTSSSAKEVFMSTITAEPGLFGSQIAFVDGVQLYFYYADWPELSVGDIVEVTGTPSESRGEPRLKISNQEDIVVLGFSEPTIYEVSSAEVANLGEGALARVSGTVFDRSGDRLTLEDADGTIMLVAHDRTDISWSALEGSNLTVTGVVRHMNGETRIYPRGVDDIEVIETTEEATATAGISSASNTKPWIGLGLLGGVLAALAYWYLRKRGGRGSRQGNISSLPLTYPSKT